MHRSADRENGCTAYAETPAITWHAAEYNPYGPGIEFERLVTGGLNDEGLSEAEPLTDNQIDWGQRIVAHLAEWGIPVVMYDGPRFHAGGWAGWVNHQALDSQRSDGLTRAEWQQIAGGSAPTPDDDQEVDVAYFVASLENPGWGIYLCDGIGVHHVPNPRAVDELVRAKVVPNHDVRQINADGWTALINYDER